MRTLLMGVSSATIIFGLLLFTDLGKKEKLELEPELHSGPDSWIEEARTSFPERTVRKPAREPLTCRKSPAGNAQPESPSAEALIDELRRAQEGGDRGGMRAAYRKIRQAGPGLLPGLVRIITGDGDPLLRVLAMNAFDGIRAFPGGEPNAAQLSRVHEAARELLASEADPELRGGVISTLLSTGSTESSRQALLQRLAADPDETMRSWVLDGLQKCPGDGTTAALVVTLESGLPSDVPTRLRTARTALSLLGRNPDPRRLGRIHRALGTELVRVLGGSDPEEGGERCLAVEIYGRTAPREENTPLIDLLGREKNPVILRGLIHWLGQRGAGRELTPTLERIAGDDSYGPAARMAARDALEDFGRK
jgi:hypothetical protein